MRKIFLYIGLAVGGYFLSVMLRGFLNDKLFYIVLANTGILLMYVLIIYQLEKVAIQKMFAPAGKKID